MQVILLERVEKLGFMGDLVEVKAGYARNFLLPQKKALRASSRNIEYFKKQKAQLEATNLKRRAEAEEAGARMSNVSISVVRQASESGHLYGSVRPQDIAAALIESNIQIARNQVDLPTPIKTLGVHKARIILHPEVFVYIDVKVAQSEEEAALLLTEFEQKAQKPQKSAKKAETEGMLEAAAEENIEEKPRKKNKESS